MKMMSKQEYLDHIMNDLLPKLQEDTIKEKQEIKRETRKLLDKMDIKDIEQYLREKKLQKLNIL